ncbi:hypothetical protein HDU98_010669 [Podochytrium sp. JEL0797]|nr:hypothetical protein HDU98_010669 [Podochytrium sp. JEL0797]
MEEPKLAIEDSLDQFLAQNSAALDAAGMPKRLHASVWGRIEAAKFGSLDPNLEEKTSLFDVALVNNTPCILASRPLIPRAAVFVFPHEWVFNDADEARLHLTQSQPLVQNLCNLILSINALQGIATESYADPIEHVMENLPRIAFSYKVTELTPNGEESVRTINYAIVSDPFGPAVISETPTGNPILTAFVFVDQRTLKPYTVLFPGWIKNSPDQDGGLWTADDDEEDPTSFSSAFILVSFTAILTLKCIMFILVDKQSYFLRAVFHLPGLFFLDLSTLALLLYPLPIRLRKFRTGVVSLILPLQTFISLMFFGYFLETNNFIDWFMFSDMDWEMFQSYSKAFRAQLLTLSFTLVGVLSLQAVIAYYLYCHFKKPCSKSYLPISYEEVEMSSSEEEERTPTAPIRVSFKSLLLLTATSFFLVIPAHSELSRLSENYLMSPSLAHLSKSISDALTPPQPEDTVPIKTPVNYTGPVFSDPLKNVVILHIESLRSDILDFHPTHHLSTLLLNKSHIPTFDTTFAPFLNTLKHSSLFYPHTQTAASYTIKSLLTTTCSTYALTGTHQEYKKQIYAPCLPQILTNHSTTFFHPADLTFDHLGTLVEHTGFDNVYGVLDIPSPKSEWLNYFGPDDRKMLPLVRKVLDKAGETGKPFQMSFMTNAGHHPFAVPADFPKQKYVENSVINDYLNAVNNGDAFIETLLSEFRTRHLMDSTLFVIVGDHGMGLSDHTVLGSSEGGFEEAFKVPLLFYSETPNFQSLARRVSNHENPSSNIDILPTILDFLQIPQPHNGHLHEGQSLLRAQAPHRALYSTGNPNMQHSQVYLQNGWKLVRDVRSDRRQFFDLDADPLEREEIGVRQQTEEQQEWSAVAYRRMLKIQKEVADKFNGLIPQG